VIERREYNFGHIFEGSEHKYRMTEGTENRRFNHHTHLLIMDIYIWKLSGFADL